jgi:hypothetical protein
LPAFLCPASRCVQQRPTTSSELGPVAENHPRVRHAIYYVLRDHDAAAGAGISWPVACDKPESNGRIHLCAKWHFQWLGESGRDDSGRAAPSGDGSARDAQHVSGLQRPRGARFRGVPLMWPSAQRCVSGMRSRSATRVDLLSLLRTRHRASQRAASPRS